MRTDHSYIRSLLRIRGEPRVPTLWLAVPWGAATAWSLGVVRAYLFAAPPRSLATAIMLALTLREFLMAGGFGLVITWPLLYMAWPEHLYAHGRRCTVVSPA